MLPTYPAVLSGDRLVWSDGAPAGLSGSVPVYVTLLTPPAPATDRRARMVAALEELAARGGLSEITDPLAWERERRADRTLPGRSE
jgi:hypothetical protein